MDELKERVARLADRVEELEAKVYLLELEAEWAEHEIHELSNTR